ncbi:MAG: multi-sensor hybrid histidine kinase [Actinobacteria bacterium]|nr:multi-sensor hybrid histidine kinase [Actinomycetota bacterium]
MPIRILLADDHKMNRHATQALLESMGYEVIGVGGGAEAVDAYTRGQFDLILMDCQMPGVDGFEATAQIRRYQDESTCVRTPIIGLSGRSLSGDRDAAIAKGMDAYVTKPPSIKVLASVLAEWASPDAS